MKLIVDVPHMTDADLQALKAARSVMLGWAVRTAGAPEGRMAQVASVAEYEDTRTPGVRAVPGVRPLRVKDAGTPAGVAVSR
jgi:hypothetical protein